MSLEPAAELLLHARRHRYAVGYFESWDLASLEGVIDAAEQSRAPVIVGFNGEFLSRPKRALPERLEYYGVLGRAAAESARVPCSVMFNECPADDWVRRAIRLGFHLVMLADAGADPDDLARRVAELVRLAHAQGVAVEAEWGILPCGVPEHAGAGKGDRTLLPERPAGCFAQKGPVPFSPGSLTDPDSAAAFVEETGIDVLAVSVGNVHMLLDGQRDLDLARLAAIRQRVDVPLALHGGSGISAGSLIEAIELGVAKVNYGTCLKQRSLAALRQALGDDDGNPHHALGYGGSEDLLVAVRRAVRDAVIERIGLLGCCGKA